MKTITVERAVYSFAGLMVLLSPVLTCSGFGILSENWFAVSSPNNAICSMEMATGILDSAGN